MQFEALHLATYNGQEDSDPEIHESTVEESDQNPYSLHYEGRDHHKEEPACCPTGALDILLNLFKSTIILEPTEITVTDVLYLLQGVVVIDSAHCDCSAKQDNKAQDLCVVCRQTENMRCYENSP